MDRHYFVAITLPNHIKEVLSSYKEERKGNYHFARGYIRKTIILLFPF